MRTRSLFAALILTGLFAAGSMSLSASEPDCTEEVMVYRQDEHDWVCDPGHASGTVCTLCDGGSIDVVG